MSASVPININGEEIGIKIEGWRVRFDCRSAPYILELMSSDTPYKIGMMRFSGVNGRYIVGNRAGIPSYYKVTSEQVN